MKRFDFAFNRHYPQKHLIRNSAIRQVMESLYLRGLEYIENLNPPLSDWLQAIKKAGTNGKVPIVDDEMGLFLKLICSVHKPKSILEIGCGISYSTHWMLTGWPNSHITALDANHERLQQCASFLKKSLCADRVELVHGWAEEFFRANTKQYDMVFLDSTKKEYIKLLEGCYKALNVRGILVVDNIFFRGKVFGMTENQVKKYKHGVDLLKKFNEEIARYPGFECTFLPLGDGVLVAQRIY